jgi:exosome complex component RRP41
VLKQAGVVLLTVFQALHDRAIINCEYSMATFSTGERKKKTKGDRRGIEISLLLRQTFEAAVITTLFPRAEIDIYVQIVQVGLTS